MKKQNHMAWGRLLACFGWLMAMAFSAVAQAQTAVESVTGSVQGGAEVVRIDFSQPLTAVPAGFSIQAPARIALDVPGATNGLGRSAVDLNVGNIRSVNVITSGDRTRLVLNLKSPTNYKAQLDGKSLLVTLDPVGATVAAAPASSSSAFSESRNRDVQPIKDLDFRRGPDSAPTRTPV